MTLPLTSILTPVFNNLRCVELLHRTLTEQTRDAPWELLLIDNGSTEPGFEAFYTRLEREPNVRVIRNGRNLGFGKANNIGLSHAAGEILALLNSDMFTLRPWLAPALARFAAEPRCGAVQGGILLPEENAPPAAWRTQTIGARFDDQGLPQYFLDGLLPDDPRLAAPLTLEAFMGTGVLLRRAAVEAVGFFDEAFDLVFLEDTDLSLRLSEAGWTIRYEPETLFHHFHASSMPYLSQEEYDRSRRANLARFRALWPWERLRRVVAPHQPILGSDHSVRDESYWK
ncbi:MAG: glycosyltransferase family 2 protein [Magnetococcales bacterium]|nr:glycosyltransferase family 2 protein [Magnetococcales bacterium]